MKQQNKAAWLHSKGHDIKSLTDAQRNRTFEQAMRHGHPPKILENMDLSGYTADWNVSGAWYWVAPGGSKGAVTYKDFPAMLRGWEEHIWPSLAPKEPLRWSNAVALLSFHGYTFTKVESGVEIDNNGTITQECRPLADVVWSFYYAHVTETPPPANLVEFDKLGAELFKQKGRWQWHHASHMSEWHNSMAQCLDDWFAQQEAGLFNARVLAAEGPPDNERATSIRIQALQHYIEDGHREAARDGLPAHINVAPEAKVEIAYDGAGRVLGCYVEALVFVSLAPQKASRLTPSQ